MVPHHHIMRKIVPTIPYAIVFLVLALVSLQLQAQTASATPASLGIAETAMGRAISSGTSEIQKHAIMWLSSFVLVQFVVTNIGLLKSGAEIDALIYKLMGSLLWFGFCFYLLENGPGFIDRVSKQFIGLGGVIAGTGTFSASYMIDWGVTLGVELLTAVDNAKAQDAGGGLIPGAGAVLAALNFLPSILAGVVAVVILCTAGLIAFKIFLITLEVGLIVMISPLSFSFLGLNALKDQGIAPFKSLISLIYRILVMAIICHSMTEVGTEMKRVFAEIGPGSLEIWRPIFSSLFSYVLLGYMAYRSDSIASSLASGSTSLGTGDVAQAAALGGAIGAALVTAGSSAKASTPGVGASIGNLMKNLSGGGSSGSVANAGAQGSGSGLAGAAPTRQASASNTGAAATSGPPARPNQASVGADSGSVAPSAGVDSGSAAPSAGVDSGGAATTAGSSQSPKTAPASAPAAPQSAKTAPASAPAAPQSANAGSGQNAGIGGGDKLESTLNKLAEALENQNARKPDTIADKLKDINRQVASDKDSGTHITINANPND
jgi:type IV secretion system protein TrbL